MYRNIIKNNSYPLPSKSVTTAPLLGNKFEGAPITPKTQPPLVIKDKESDLFPNQFIEQV